MSETLEKLLKNAEVGGIKDHNKIERILSSLLNTKVSNLVIPSENGKKSVYEILIDDCSIDSKMEKILFRDVIALLFNAKLFPNLTTTMDNGLEDEYIYPSFISLNIALNFIKYAKDIPEINRFLNINFYNNSQVITKRISSRDFKKSARLSGLMMRSVSSVNEKQNPSNDATILDIFKIMQGKFVKPWCPGVEPISKYVERTKNICDCTWLMLVVFLYEAYQLDEVKIF